MKQRLAPAWRAQPNGANAVGNDQSRLNHTMQIHVILRSINSLKNSIQIILQSTYTQQQFVLKHRFSIIR
jgi:hypothetical protein